MASAVLAAGATTAPKRACQPTAVEPAGAAC